MKWFRQLNAGRRWALAIGAACVWTSLALGQTVVVDNEGAGFTLLSGSWATGAYGTPYGTNYNWAYTTGAGYGEASCEWRPSLPAAGAYRVSCYYVQGTNRAVDAPFTIHHVGGTTTVDVNQQIAGETWVDLGTFTFNAGTGGSVSLGNAAGASVVIADAVRFVAETTTVDVTFELTPVGWGTISPAPGTYTYSLDQVVSISAQASAGYEFNHWAVSAGSGVADPLSATTTVTADQDKTVTAVFVEDSPVAPEFRGFWADAFHEGFKSQAEIDDMITRALVGNYNAIVPEVLAFQDTGAGGHGAYWYSAIVPLASDISGSFDPLAYLVQEAHAAGLEVHPWLVTYRICSTWPPAGNALVAAHPEWVSVLLSAMGTGPQKIGSYYEFDPGSPEVQEYLISIVRELVTNYEVDGIHWDYIRYTNSGAGYPAYTWYTQSGLARFQAITPYSGTPATDYAPWKDFRRREVTEHVRRAQVEVATITSNPRQPLRHTAALITWGNAPADFEDCSAYSSCYQDWRSWMEAGYLDAGIPMTYYNYNTYPTWYRNWVDQEMVWRYDRHMFVGPGIYLNSLANSVTEITYAQNAGADGICTYSYVGTSNEGADWDWYPYAATTVFTEPTAPPPMTWRNPATATEGTVYGRVTDGTTGAPLDDATVYVNGFPVAQADGNGFFVITHLSASANGTPVPLSASYPEYASAARPAVLVERAGHTEANLALGDWLPGDYDVDGDVDLADYARFEPCMTSADVGPPAAGCDLFDFEHDNDVDLLNFADFQATFGS